MVLRMDTVRISTPQALLRLLPRITGGMTAPSLVVLPFAGRRSGMPMAFDLPEPGASRREVRALARAILGHAPSADAVVLVACLEDPIGAGSLPLGVELRDLADALGRTVAIRDSLALAPDAWGDYARPEAAMGPLAELDLLDDPAPHVSDAVTALPPVPSGASDAAHAVADALDALLERPLLLREAEPLDAFARAIALAPSLEHGERTGLGVDPAAAAAIAIAIVASPRDRDLALALALDGAEAAARAEAAIDDPGSPACEAGAMRLLGQGEAPDAERLREHLRAWSAIAEATPLELRAPLLVIVGFLHFFLGRGRTAARCAELAEAIDPRLTMAPLLRDVVDARGAPEWVLRDLRAPSAAA